MSDLSSTKGEDEFGQPLFVQRSLEFDIFRGTLIRRAFVARWGVVVPNPFLNAD